jgi:hypothetical protein
MRPQPAWKPAYFHRFRDQAAAAVLVTTATFLAGYRGAAGLPARSAWVFWAGDTGALVEVVAHPWADPPFVRISFNQGFRNQTRSLLKRIGIVCRGTTYRRTPSRLGCHYFVPVATPPGEITCLEHELPQLAAIAVALAQGRQDVAKLPGAELLLCSELKSLNGTRHYLWTKKADELRFGRKPENGRAQ